MAKRKLTEAQRIATEKTARGAARYRRAVAIKQNKEKPTAYLETHVQWKDVKAGDIVFPESGSRPYVAAVDAFPSTGPVDGLTVVRDEQTEDHLYYSAGVACVLREFDPGAVEPEPEPEDPPPWEM